VVAYLDEPPFGIPAQGGAPPSGCDMELAGHALRGAGVARVDHQLTTFPELIPGLLDRRWPVITPIFVTPERAEVVAFSRPVWAAEDGFIVRRDDADRYTSYEAIAASADAVLAVVRGQVQHETARRAGVPDVRVAQFDDQHAAAEAVREGRADASASTAAGNRAYLGRAAAGGGLAAVTNRSPVGQERVPVGAFAFHPQDRDLRAAVDAVLEDFLGSPGHLDLMARYGW